ncbi:MAG: molybdopterin-binding protein [Candidatus Nanopelagicaceae bacterium]
MLERMRVDEFLTALLSIVRPLDSIDLPLLDAHGATLAEDLFAAERLLLKAGAPIRSTTIGLAASIGLGHLPTRPQPRVVVISAGPDLIEPGNPITGSQEFETNSWQLTTIVREIGGVGYRVHSIPDNETELKDVVEDQLVRADLIVISGERHDDSFDLITRAISSLGEIKIVDLELENTGRFNYGAIGPDKTPVITLPGEPISAYIAMQLFVRPMIRTMLGAKEIYCPSVKAKLERDYPNSINNRSYLLAQLSEDNQSVHIFPEQEDFLSLANSNAMVSVSPGDKLKAGDNITTVILPRIK